MKNSELLKQAEKLTSAHENLEMAINYLDAMVCAVHQGDDVTGTFFLKGGSAGNVVDNMQNVSNLIMEVSNKICPQD